MPATSATVMPFHSAVAIMSMRLPDLPEACAI